MTLSWLDSLVDQHNELESPRSFWFWAGLAAISAVVKDNVWINKQIYNLYPNIYVMFHADSGLKKGPPVSMSKQLVKAVNNTRIISGRSSIQAILKELGTAYTMPGGKVMNRSVAFICSSELSSSIVEDKAATKLLTDLYDRQYNIGEWRQLLKQDTFTLKDPTVTMLTATNEAMSEDFFTRSAIRGGYVARTFVVYEKESQNVNSLIYPLANPPNYIHSAEYLKELSKLSGPFKSIAHNEQTNEYKHRKVKKGRDVWFNNVGIKFDDWYEQFTKQKRDSEFKDETGTLNRFDDSVLKIAMLLSLAKEPELEITEETMDQAIKECEQLVGNVVRTTLGKQGISESAALKTMVIHELLARQPHQITRTVLMRRLWQNYGDSTEFDNMMQMFDAAGMIKTNSIGNQIVYTMTETQAEELKKLMDGKMGRRRE